MPDPYRAPQELPPPPKDPMRFVLGGAIVFTVLVVAVVAFAAWSDRKRPPDVDTYEPPPTATPRTVTPEAPRSYDWPGKPQGFNCPKGQYARKVMSGEWACCPIGAMCD